MKVPTTPQPYPHFYPPRYTDFLERKTRKIILYFLLMDLEKGVGVWELTYFYNNNNKNKTVEGVRSHYF